jgi:hypothetical protein
MVKAHPLKHVNHVVSEFYSACYVNPDMAASFSAGAWFGYYGFYFEV